MGTGSQAERHLAHLRGERRPECGGAHGRSWHREDGWALSRPAHAGPGEGFSDVYLKVSRKLLGTYGSTEDRVMTVHQMRVFTEFIPTAGGVYTAGAQLGGQCPGPGESWRWAGRGKSRRMMFGRRDCKEDSGFWLSY